MINNKGLLPRKKAVKCGQGRRAFKPSTLQASRILATKETHSYIDGGGRPKDQNECDTSIISCDKRAFETFPLLVMTPACIRMVDHVPIVTQLASGSSR